MTRVDIARSRCIPSRSTSSVRLENTTKHHRAQPAHRRALGDTRPPSTPFGKRPRVGETSLHRSNVPMASTPPPRLGAQVMLATVLQICCAGAMLITGAIASSSTATHHQRQIRHLPRGTGRNPLHAPFLQVDAPYSTSRNGWERPCSTLNRTLDLDSMPAGEPDVLRLYLKLCKAPRHSP